MKYFDPNDRIRRQIALGKATADAFGAVKPVQWLTLAMGVMIFLSLYWVLNHLAWAFITFPLWALSFYLLPKAGIVQRQPIDTKAYIQRIREIYGK